MKPEIKTKVDELERLRARAGAIVAEYKGSGLPAEKDLEVKTIIGKCQELRGEIETAQSVEQKEIDLQDIDKFLREPERKIPHGINGDDDDRKRLTLAGWEFKGGMAYAPTSSGKHYEMFSEDVLLGDIPSDPAAADYYKTTRAAMGDDYRAAYVKFWRALAASSGEVAFAMNKLSPSEQKALSEGTDSAGGFTVPPDTQGELLSRTAQQAVMRRLARVQTTNRDVLKWPMMKANATNGSIYSSGFVGTWATETPAFTDTDPAFQMFDIPIKKIRVATKISNDLIMDSAFNLLASLAVDGSQNMALTEDYGLINGAGSANEPLGLLQGGFTTYDVEGTTSNTISNTTASSGSAAKIIAGVYLIPDQYVDGSTFLVSRTNEGKIAALVDGNGRPFWSLNAGSGFGAPPRNIEGLPIANSSWMPADGTDANKVIFTGNIAQAYIIAQRAQITTTVLRERFADTDQTGIIIWDRLGGATWNPDAGRIGIV